MCPFQQYPVLETLLSPFRRSQQKTLAIVIAAVAAVAQARSRSIAGYLSRSLGVQLGSALTRFYRLLANHRIEDGQLTESLLRLLASGKTMLIALDWTKWPHDLQMLVATVICGRRAIPVQTRVTPDRGIWQNSEEERFLAHLAKTLKTLSQKAVLICDRGFRRVAWIERLLQIHQGFIVRLVSNVTAQGDDAEPTLLRDVALSRGQSVDLGWVMLREDQAVRVRVVGIWGRRQKEAWWLATNLNGSVEKIASLYHKRMDIEEQFRDTKGCRFGVKMEWTQFRTPAYLARFALLVGIALLLWTVAGAAKVAKDTWAQLVCRTKGPRVSLPQVGILYLEEFAKRITVGFVRKFLPRPKLERFEQTASATAAK